MVEILTETYAWRIGVFHGYHFGDIEFLDDSWRTGFMQNVLQISRSEFLFKIHFSIYSAKPCVKM